MPIQPRLIGGGGRDDERDPERRGDAFDTDRREPLELRGLHPRDGRLHEGGSMLTRRASSWLA